MFLAKRTPHRIALGAAVAIATGAMLSTAQAQPMRPNGYPVTNVNLRAGPGTEYPVIVTVPVRAPITILGCLPNYSWCDSIFQGNRGWMRSIYLSGYYQGNYYSLGDYAPRLGYRTVSFDIEGYWGSNYRNRPFYGERTRWTRRPREEGYVDTGVFYNRLAPYGDWVWIQGQYVWVPSRVDRSWRPYTRGRWVFTDRGWTWVSREPFGWATYHYGRWGFSNRVGWFWVPGNRWAPAWVSWRQSDDYLAWAPMPPTYDGGISINVSIGTVPDYYWQVVPSRAFLSNDLQQQIERDRNRQRPILERTRPLGNTTITNNNVVVNNVVNVTYVEEKTQEKVVERKIAKAKDAKEAGKVEGDAVEIFQPAAAETPADLAPPEPKKIEKVAEESETKDQAEGEATTEEMLVPPEIQKAAEESEAAKAATGEAPKSPSLPKGVEASSPPPEGAAPVGEPVPAEDLTPAAEEAPPPVDATPAPDTAAPPSPPADEEKAPAKAKEKAPKAKKDTGEGSVPKDLPAIKPLPQEAPPPPAREATPPPPPPLPPAEEPAPKVKKQPKKEKGEKAKPAESAAPPPPPPPPAQEEAAPPPPPPPPPPAGDVAPMTKEGKPKPKKYKGEPAQPDQGPPPSFAPPPPPKEAAPPPPPAASDVAPKAKKDGQAGGKPKKGKGEAPGQPCPEGMVPLEDGSCAPAE